MDTPVASHVVQVTDVSPYSKTFDSIEELLEASFKKGYLAKGNKYDDKKNQVEVYEFADPQFKDYLIRVTNKTEQRHKNFSRAALTDTISLTPPDYIFHGNNIGQPLLESKTKDFEHVDDKNISIMKKQPGTTIHDVIKKGKVNEIFANGVDLQSICKLYKTVAFLGAFEHTIDMKSLPVLTPSELDIYQNNIMVTDKGEFNIIDQMTATDIGNSKQGININKARQSVKDLQIIFEMLGEEIFKEDIEFNEFIKEVKEIQQETLDILSLANKLGTDEEALTYLRKYLVPDNETWRGVEAINTSKNRTNYYIADKIITPLDITNASPSDLLNVLQSINNEYIAPSR